MTKIKKPTKKPLKSSKDITAIHDAEASQQHPIQTIGILGGGQLGMMLAQAAIPLGYECVFLEDAPHCPASKYGKVYSTQQLEDFAQHANVFTLEFENTPVATVEWLASLSANREDVAERDSSKHGMYPPAIALQIAQDRLAEKALFNELGIATVPFLAVSSANELVVAVEQLGLPLVLKTSRGGYDGKGQCIIREQADIATAWDELGGAVTGHGNLTSTPAPLIAESFITFSREVSIIAVRGQNNSEIHSNNDSSDDGLSNDDLINVPHNIVRTYELVENHHHNGILAKTQAPAVGISHLRAQANEAITKLLNHLDYVGVMALELFVCKDNAGHDTILANEIAPRVHNSGHWSIEGAVTSQFENHIRAVVGLPLGDTANVHPSIIVNVLGEYPNLADVLAIDGSHYHSYHKTERDNRKIAHITLMPNDPSLLNKQLEQLVHILPNKVGLG